MGEDMLRSTAEKNRLYLTSELRASDAMTLPSRDRVASVLFKSDLKRFPPIEELIASLDRTASRVSVA
jgi:hypothetical protein